MSGLGPVSKRIALGRGLNTHPDPTVLAEGELQTATRVRFHKGDVYKDKGVIQYGVDTDATTTAQGIGYHFHPTDPRLLVAADGDLKIHGTTSNNEPAWTDIKTGLNATADVCFAGQAGASFAANGIDRVQRYAGGTATTELVDFPSPEDVALNYNPNPDDVLMDSCETAGAILTVASAPTAGGTGYSVGNVLTITTGGTGGTATVLTVSSGVVLTLSLTTAGTSYTTGTGKATTVAPAGGSGCTVNITSVQWAPTGTGTAPTATADTSVYIWGGASMKFVSTGDATGDRIDRDLGSGGTLDLSDSDYLSFWLLASVEGDYLVFKMSEDNATFFTKWVSIPTDKVNQWVQVVWDLRGISPNDRDAIRYLRFGIPGTQACTIYIDHLCYCGPLAGEYLYAVSYIYSETGESGPIGAFRKFATLEPDDYTQALASRTCVIPSATVYLPTGADKLRLYRTMAGASGTFYKIADITPSANAWTYTDTTPDNELAEADAVVLWPGTAPRSQWLIPHGDRMLHAGGMVVASRNDAHWTVTPAQPVDYNTATMNPSPYPPLPAYGFEFYVDTGAASAALTFSFQRSPKTTASWTTVATATATQAWSSSTWYRLPFTGSAYGDIMFDTKRYQWRIICTAAPAALKLGVGWDPSPLHLEYRLLCYAHNLVFMSNLGQPDKLPPMDVTGEDVNELAGGHFIVGEADGQKINGWAKHGSDLLIFKERLTYLVTGLTMDDVEVALVHPGEGCKEWRTSIDCDGSAVWMAADRQIYIWESESAPQMLSKPIEEFFDGLTDAQTAGACAVYSERRYYIWLPAAAAGSRCRYYDFDERAWATGNDSQVYAAMAHGHDPSVAQPYLLRIASSVVEVIKLNNSEAEESGNVTWVARSRAEEFGDIIPDTSTVKRLRGYRLWVKGTAADTITTKWYVDRGTTATRTYTDTIPSGSGFQAIERFGVHNDIMGENLAVEVGGAHDTEVAVAPVDTWVLEVR